jgi:hypothetical protein
MFGANTFGGAYFGQAYAGKVAQSYVLNLIAALTFTGSHVKKASKPLTGGLSFVGTFVGRVLNVVAFTAALTFSGSYGKSVRKTLAGGLSLIGAIISLYKRDTSPEFTVDKSQLSWKVEDASTQWQVSPAEVSWNASDTLV